MAVQYPQAPRGKNQQARAGKEGCAPGGWSARASLREKPGAITSISQGVASTPASTSTDAASASDRAHRACDASRFFLVAFGQQVAHRPG